LSVIELRFQELFDYCLSVFPERFFDILNQSDSLFDDDVEANTHFLPDVDFKMLFRCKGVSETTCKSMWKYLQLILFTVIGTIKDKSIFGQSADLFEGVDETELQEKLTESMAGISEFFSNITSEKTQEEEEEGKNNSGENKEMPEFGKFADMFGKDFKEKMEKGAPGSMFENMPDPEKLHDHIKQIMGGKIGALASELAEELSKDFSDLIDETSSDIKTPQDVFKKIAKNPKKMMDMVKTVGSKLDEKMKSGEINREDIMKEASEIMRHMKEMGGGSDQFSEMMKNMANMKIPKNARMDTAAMDRMTKMEATKERLRNKLKAKQTENYSISQASGEDTSKFVFRTNDGEVQAKSSALPKSVPSQGYIDPSLLADPIVGVSSSNGDTNSKKKKKKGKK
jgi:hypothetical protein